MTYTITNFDAATAQITMQVANLAPIVVDLPIDEQGNLPTGTDLDLYLSGFIPTWHLDRLNRIAAGINNASDIQALVQPGDGPPLQAPTVVSEDTSFRDAVVAVLEEIGLYTAPVV